MYKDTIKGNGIKSKITNFTRKITNNFYVNRIIKQHTFYKDCEFAKEDVMNFCKKHNINTESYFNKLLKNMQSYSELNNIIHNKEFINIVKSAYIIENMDELYSEYFYLEDFFDDQSFILSGHLFILGIDSEFNTDEIQNKFLLELMIETHNPTNKPIKYSSNINSYAKNMITYNKNYKENEEINEHFMSIIKSKNINNATFYEKLVNNMENKPYFNKMLRNKEYMNILKNMFIVKEIDDYYIKHANRKNKKLQFFVENLEQSGVLFVFGKGQSLKPTRGNNSLVEVINQTA